MKNIMLFVPLIWLLHCSPALPWRKYDVNDMRQRWESDMKKFDRMSRKEMPEEAILFYGSSSIRLWKDIESDMAPYPTIRRGYGGAALHDAAYYAKRVLSPIDYRALVIFVGNDIWGTAADKSPAEMVDLMDLIVSTSRRHRPVAPVFLVEVTHIPARDHLVEEINAANDALADYAERHANVYFIPTRDIYLDDKGKVRRDYFRDDDIHQNEDGYRAWKNRIKTEIKQVLPAQPA